MSISEATGRDHIPDTGWHHEACRDPHGYEITRRTIDKKGQILLIPDIEANVWWTNTGFTDREVIGHYHTHGESEQFPKPTALACELKTDKILSGSHLVSSRPMSWCLELAILSYKYLDSDGVERYAYSWRLDYNDLTPKGKKKDLSLREKEKQIEQDLFNQAASNGENYTVLELVEKYTALKVGVGHNTLAGYKTVINILKKDALAVNVLTR